MSFLVSKIQIPTRPHHAVDRNRLTEVLEQAVPQYKLIYVGGPAGYGKTTLLTQWARSSQWTVVWLSIGEEDNDFASFMRYLVTAWERVQPDIRDTALGKVMGGANPNRDIVLSTFINVANETLQHFVFVLDDCHLIQDTAIHEALAFLFDHLPPMVHFVVASRAEPPIPLAKYRAKQTLHEIRVEDLQFTIDEAATFLNQFTENNLPDEDIAALHQQLEGWAAGLQLVGLTLQKRLANGDKLVVSGRHRFIADYLNEDVLAPLEPALRLFLLQTSILDRLCGSLCDTVTGQDNGQTMLEHLEQQNLFLVALDESREWFRYHQLFSQFLKGELKRRYPEDIADLHRRAAGWYLEQEIAEAAFEHGVKSNDVELVIRIINRFAYVKLLSGEVRVLEDWMDLIPEAWLSEYPEIALLQASTLLITGQIDACIQRLDKIEQQMLDRNDMQSQLARVTAFRCFMACRQNHLTQAEMLADQALRDLPEEDLSFRLDVFGALGDTYRKRGLWDEAQKYYHKALDFSHAPTFRVQAVHIFGALADLDLRRGRLQSAADYWRKALVAIEAQENWGNYPLPLIGWVYIRMGELLYEWNELANAEEHLSQGLERAELGGDVRAMIAGYLNMGRLKLTQGDIEAAVNYLNIAQPLVEKAQFAHWISRFERFQLDVWLAQDRLRAAVDWADRMLGDAAIEERPESDSSQLAMARVLILKGDEPSVAQALRVIRDLLIMAENDGRMGIVIEGLMLQALACWRHHDTQEALTALERALRLARPEGYIRLFADTGLSLVRLLQEAHRRGVMVGYIEKLLKAIDLNGSVQVSNEALLEPLTERESEIIRLIAAGLTNPEIGEELGISAETVKKHASSIYGKLGVNNRTEASARARELDLLG